MTINDRIAARVRQIRADRGLSSWPRAFVFNAAQLAAFDLILDDVAAAQP